MAWGNETTEVWGDAFKFVSHPMLRLSGSLPSFCSLNASCVTLDPSFTQVPILCPLTCLAAPPPRYTLPCYRLLRWYFLPQSLRQCHIAYCSAAVVSDSIPQLFSCWRNLAVKRKCNSDSTASSVLKVEHFRSTFSCIRVSVRVQSGSLQLLPLYHSGRRDKLTRSSSLSSSHQLDPTWCQPQLKQIRLWKPL